MSRVILHLEDWRPQFSPEVTAISFLDVKYIPEGVSILLDRPFATVRGAGPVVGAVALVGQGKLKVSASDRQRNGGRCVCLRCIRSAGTLLLLTRDHLLSFMAIPSILDVSEDQIRDVVTSSW